MRWKLEVGDWKLKVGKVLAIFVLALLPRIVDLDVFVTPDEIKWVCRSINFHRALRQGEFAQTFQTGHPGVVTMWIGVWGMPIDLTEDWLQICQEPKTSKIVTMAPRQVLARLTEFLYAARRAVALLTAISVVGIYLLLEKLFDRRVALFSAILIAWDPFYLALSRLLHLDALTASFMILSFLSLLVYLASQPHSWIYLVLSGSMAGLSILTKSPAVFVCPFALLLVAVFGYRRRETALQIGRTLFLWGAVVGVVVFALWPATWVDPIGTAQKVVGVALGYAEEPHCNLNFFWGEIRPDPGIGFYPVALLFRMTPLTMLGAFLAILLLLSSRRRGEPVLSLAEGKEHLIALLAYVFLFMAFMTLGAKKFDRYILPVFPALDIFAAVGFIYLSDGKLKIGNWKLEVGSWKPALSLAEGLVIGHWSLVIVLFLLQAGYIFSYHPYYFPYYNPLLGGSAQAPHILLVGWGEGLDEAANYLNQKEDAEKLKVALRAVTDFGPLFVGRTVDAESYDPATVDYVVIYLKQLQRNLSPELIERYYKEQQPEYVVRLHGIEYAWIYLNLNYIPLMEYIEKNAKAEEDLILVSRPSSLLAKHYEGDLPLHVVEEGWSEEEVVEALRDSSSNRRRIWYVKYQEKDPNPTLELVDYQLEIHTYKVEELVFPDIELKEYQVFDTPSFEVSEIERPLKLNFADQLELRGCGYSEETISWGKALGVAFEWKALRDIELHYAAFLHLVDEEGHMWGQGDKWLMNESLIPTAGWQAGDVVVDRYSVSLLKGTPPGRYKLKIGLYDRINGGRLEIRDSSETLLGDSYDVGTVEVKSSPLALSPGDLEIQHPLERDLAGQVKLLGYGLDKEEVSFGEQFTLALYWQALRKMEGDYSLVVRLRGGNRIWAEGKFWLGGKHYLTSHWKEGEVLWDRYDLKVDAEAPRVEGILEIDLLDAEEESLLEKPVALAKMNIQGRLFTSPEISHPMKANLGEDVDFLGYDLETKDIRAGDTIHLTLYWQAKREMNISYTVFTHLLGEDNKLWGQKDDIPMQGRHPTTQWQEGEVIVDEYDIIVKDEIPEGKYRLEVGMYDAETMQRLRAFDEEGARMLNDSILLPTTLKAEIEE